MGNLLVFVGVLITLLGFFLNYAWGMDWRVGSFGILIMLAGYGYQKMERAAARMRDNPHLQDGEDWWHEGDGRYQDEWQFEKHKS